MNKNYSFREITFHQDLLVFDEPLENPMSLYNVTDSESFAQGGQGHSVLMGS